MSIITILVALLLSGSGNFTAHPGSVSGGGPVSAPQAATPIPGGGLTTDSVVGGGPVI
jgi:hypothetical protein